MEKKVMEIWQWMGMTKNHKNGVTNKQVIDEFGVEYIDAWEKLKSRLNGVENGLFYEDKKWFRWFPNHR